MSSGLRFNLNSTWQDICTIPTDANKIVALWFNSSNSVINLSATRISGNKIQGWAPSAADNYVEIWMATIQYTKTTD